MWMVALTDKGWFSRAHIVSHANKRPLTVITRLPRPFTVAAAGAGAPSGKVTCLAPQPHRALPTVLLRRVCPYSPRSTRAWNVTNLLDGFWKQERNRDIKNLCHNNNRRKSISWVGPHWFTETKRHLHPPKLVGPHLFCEFALVREYE